MTASWVSEVGLYFGGTVEAGSGLWEVYSEWQSECEANVPCFQPSELIRFFYWIMIIVYVIREPYQNFALVC